MATFASLMTGSALLHGLRCDRCSSMQTLMYRFTMPPDPYSIITLYVILLLLTFVSCTQAEATFVEAHKQQLCAHTKV